MTKSDKLLVGAHMSISGSVLNAIEEAESLGCTTFQIFTANQRQWRSKGISEREAFLFKKQIKEKNFSKIMSHDSYLINLGSIKKDLLDKSLKAFSDEISRCHQLDLDYLNFHPGSAVGSDEKTCLDTICKSLLSLSSLINRGRTKLLIETTAGQGSNVGYKFEHLGYIIEKVSKKIPIGVCIDTCHIFAAGYDIRDEIAWKKTLLDFDKTIGLKNLLAFHVNDSKYDLGSRKDRHAPLGDGKIGKNCFKFLMQDKNLKNIPKYLETPMGDKNWKNEIKMLFDFAKE